MEGGQTMCACVCVCVCVCERERERERLVPWMADLNYCRMLTRNVDMNYVVTIVQTRHHKNE